MRSDGCQSRTKMGPFPGVMLGHDFGLACALARVAPTCLACAKAHRPKASSRGVAVSSSGIALPALSEPEAPAVHLKETAVSHRISGIVRQRGPAARSRTAAASRSPPRAWRTAPRPAASPRPSPSRARIRASCNYFWVPLNDGPWIVIRRMSPGSNSVCSSADSSRVSEPLVRNIV